MFHQTRLGRRGMRTLVALAAAAGLSAVLPAASAYASSSDTALAAPQGQLQHVENFGPNPTGLGMDLYVPASVKPRPAVVVALHYCTGSGPAMFAGTQWASLADKYGFVVVYPSATRAGHCFDVSSSSALRHDGNSDPVGIVSMVKYVEAHDNVNPQKVFATGISSGAMMTNVLLGDYPDVFRAGSAMSGVAFGCFATTDGSSWNGTCSSGHMDKTPQQWGDIVRSAYPGYHGRRPSMQLFHGTADAILAYPNFGEEVDEWTNVLNTGSTPAVVESPRPGWTHSEYLTDDGRVGVDAYSVEGGSHNLAFDAPDIAQLAAAFFGVTSE